jgi:hypothetical protein
MGTLNLEFNKIFIIQSLADDERTGDEINKRIGFVLLRQKDDIIKNELIDVSNSSEFFNALTKVLQSISEGYYPYIHFEIHGCPSGFVLLNDDFVGWDQLKAPLLEINVRCKNNLYVSLATCYGAGLIRLFKPWEVCPFFGYIGPEHEVDTPEVEATYIEYFDSLLTERSFSKALIQLRKTVPGNEENYQVLNCLEYFRMLYELSREQGRFSNPREINQLKKTIVNDMKKTHPNKSKKELRKVVERLDFEKYEENAYKKIRKIFLHGKDYPDLEIN